MGVVIRMMVEVVMMRVVMLMMRVPKGPGTLNGVVKLWMSCVFLVLPGLQMNSKADHNPHAN